MPGFNLTAAVNLVWAGGGASALKAQVLKEFSGLSIPVGLKIDPSAASRLNGLNTVLSKVTANLREITAASATASAGLNRLASSFSGAGTSSARTAQGVASLHNSLQRVGQ